MKKLYLFLMAMIVAVAANAAKVYFDPAGCTWTNVNAYVWGGESGEVKGWPGTAMTKNADSGLWEVEFDKTPGFVIFNNGSNQTPGDMPFFDGATYKVDGTWTGGGEVEYVTMNVTYDNTDTQWDTVYIHYWGNGNNTSWPGEAMVKGEGNTWTYSKELLALPTEIIFNNQGKGAQSDNLTFENDKTWDVNGVTGGVTPPEPGNPVLYFRGAINNYGATDEYKMTEADGVYTLTLDKLSGAFKIADANWKDSYTTSKTDMELGTQYTMAEAPATGGDMSLAGSASNVTITFDYNAMTLKIEGTPYEPVVGYKINSDLSVATWSMAEMTEADGLFTYTVTPAQAEGEMQVVKTLDGTATDYLGSTATISEENNEVTMAAGAGNLKYSLEAETAYTFTFDPATSKLSVEKATVPPTPEYPVLYVRGAFNNNVADATSLMTQEAGVYTLSLDKLTGNFKIADEEWGVQFSSKNTAMALDTEYAMEDASGLGGDMAIEGAATDVTITFDYNTMKVKVEGTASVPEIGYKINSDLSVATWSMVEMTETEGVYEYTVTPAQAEGQMQVVKTVDGVASEYLGNGDATLSEEENEVTLSAGAGNLKYSLSTESAYKFTFNPESGVLTVAAVEVPPTPEMPELYIVGEEYGNWAKDEAYKMTRVDNVYTISMADGLSGAWKIFDGTENFDISFGKGAEEPVAGENYDAWFNAANFTFNTENAVKITFTLVEGSAVQDSSIPSILLIEEASAPVVDMPEKLYLIGNVNGNGWNTATPVEMTKVDNTFVATNVLLDNAGGDVSYFSFVTLTGEDWTAVNASDLYGATANNAPIAVGESAEMKLFAAGVDAGSAFSWKLAYVEGGVDIVADFENMTVSVSANTGIEAVQSSKNIKVFGGMISVEGAEQVAVYSTNGALVSRAAETQLPAGLYIVVADGVAAKVMVK